MSDQNPDDKPVNITSTTEIKIDNIADSGQVTAFKTTGPVQNLYLVQNIQAGTVVAGAAARQPGVLAAPRSRQAFYGRADQVTQAGSVLQQGQTVLLYGLGGIGKTALPARSPGAWKAHQISRGACCGSRMSAEPRSRQFATLSPAAWATTRSLNMPLEAKPDATRQLLGSQRTCCWCWIVSKTPSPPRISWIPACRRICPCLATSRRLHTSFHQPLEMPALEREEAIALFQDRSKITNQRRHGRRHLRPIGKSSPGARYRRQPGAH